VDELKAAFFTVSDAGYFLGTAAMVTSLRRSGAQEEIVVLDAGLREEQVAALRKTCHVVPLDSAHAGAANATYYKLLAPLTVADERDIDVVVLIDGDMIVTHSLADLLDVARGGSLVAYADPNRGRWCPEWQEIFGLDRAPRRQTYVNAGFVAFSRRAFPELLPRWQAACDRIADHPTMAEGARGPTEAGDQDALNAVLMSHYPSGVLHVRPPDESPQGHDLVGGARFARPRIVDRATLACEYRGTDVRILHSSGNNGLPKPWKSWRGMGRNAYTELLVDMLATPGPGVEVLPAAVPWWLRRGDRASTARTIVDAVVLGRALARRLPKAAWRRVRALSLRAAPA
jgi:hypothetical protein